MSAILLLRCRRLGLSLCALLCGMSLCNAQIPAFPGAEGFGAYANGGRGGDVYTVVNLNSSGAGSLRYGIETAPASGRTIVFAVSGYIPINYNSDTGNQTVRLVQNKITIAGQTAPGDGIGLKDGRVLVTGDDAVIRHIRVRHGKYGAAGDCVNIESSANNTLLDHVSLMFSTDENISFFNSAVDNFTMQYCTSSWGMERHNAGGLWDLDRGSCHHTLWAHHRTRNPKARPLGLLEWINNVTYHWRSEGFIMGDSTSVVDWYANIIGCYYLSIADYDFGLDTTPLSKAQIALDGQPNFHLYLSDTLIDANGNGVLDGVDNGYAIASGSPAISATPFAGAPVPVTTDDPLTAYKKVISSAGPLRLDATYTGPLRDELDDLLIESIENQESILVAKDTPVTTNPEEPPSNGEQHLADAYGISNNGFGTLNTAAYPDDTDGDGMPDFWEITIGSDHTVANHNDPVQSGIYIPTSPAGYTMLEEYLQFKAMPHAVMEKNTASSPSSLTVDMRRYTRGFTKNPAFSIFVFPVFGSYQQFAADGTTPSTTGPVIVFTPAQGFSGRAAIRFTVSDSDGSSWEQKLAVFVNGVEPPKNLVWQGDGSANVWNTTTPNFLDGAAPSTFSTEDSVLFDDTGSRSPAVQIAGTLLPGAVQVSTDLGYTFGGSGALAGEMSLVKNGSGSLTIANTGPNTYSGGTVINAGAVKVNAASGTGSGSVTVNSGGTLAGSGSISGAVTVNSGGSIAPGASIGTLTVNNHVTLKPGSATVIEINKTAGTADLLDASGTLTLGGMLLVSNLGGTLAEGDSFKIFDAGSYSGTFGATNLPALSGSLKWNLVNLKTSGTIAVLDGSVPPDPPLGLTATAGDTQVSLGWLESGGATGYIVKRAVLNGGPYTSIVTNPTPSYTDNGLINGQTYYYVVSALNASGESADSLPASATPVKIISYRINSGGPAASPFSADNYYVSGSTYTNAGAINTSGVVDPAPASVYQTERNGNFSYVVPGLQPGSSYLVRLHFAEIFHSASGLRTFNVLINGAQVLTNFDIFAVTGARYKAMVREFSAVADGSGRIVIEYVTVLNNAKSSGIEILTPPPSLQITMQPLNQSVTAGSAAVFVVQATGSPLPSYQWMKNGANLAGQTNAILSIGSAQSADEGVYSVAAFNSQGVVISSNATLTVGEVSYLPTGLFATPGNNQVALNWFDAVDATGYNVKRAASSGGPYQTIATVTDTFHTDHSAQNGSTYFYVVSALAPGGESNNSTEVEATPAAILGGKTIQVEDISVTNWGGVTLDNNNPGFHYTRFANFPTTGGNVQFNHVDGGTGGSAQIVIRFALGATTARAGSMVVNGATTSITFQPTGNWTNWVTMSVNATLAAGSANTIRFVSTGQDLGNIDEITVIPTVANNTPPQFTSPVPDQYINVGRDLAITNSVVDADAVTFSLQDGPPGSVLTNITAGSCVFRWRPQVTQAGATNQVVIKATDSGTPNLSSTSQFKVIVHPMTTTEVSVPMVSGAQIGLSVNGQIGPDYAVEGSTNLVDWTTLLITNPPAMPFTWSTDTDAAPVQYFRIQVGPPLL